MDLGTAVHCPTLKNIHPAWFGMFRSFVIACLTLIVGGVSAQGGFQTLDPFYVGESARHVFHGDLAVSGELTVRDRDLLGISQPGTPAGALAVAGRLDYALLSQVDVSAVVDLSGSVGNGPLGLSWVVVKPYWHNEGTDYAIRVAVDPVSEGALGFRQTDIAFLSSSLLSPSVSSDFVVGLRRVRVGYDDVVNEEVVDEVFSEGEDADPSFFSGGGNMEGERRRLLGQELRVSWGYNVMFDPAGSAVSIGIVGEGGNYKVVSSPIEEEDPDSTPTSGEEAEQTDRIRSGVGWIRAGIDFNRPSFQVSPYLSVPVLTWADVRGEEVSAGPRPGKARLGLRITFR